MRRLNSVPKQKEQLRGTLEQRMADAKRRDAEKYAVWLEEWQQDFAGVGFADVEIWSLLTTASKGAYLAIELNDYAAALSYLTALFAHPHIDTVDNIVLFLRACQLVTCLLYTGDEARAIESVDRWSH